ncbi:MAG: hypothetical protein AB1894_17135 [Chloroflexota bacterium]
MLPAQITQSDHGDVIELGGVQDVVVDQVEQGPGAQAGPVSAPK